MRFWMNLRELNWRCLFSPGRRPPQSQFLAGRCIYVFTGQKRTFVGRSWYGIGHIGCGLLLLYLLQPIESQNMSIKLSFLIDFSRTVCLACGWYFFWG
jgi:hypothetical protein